MTYNPNKTKPADHDKHLTGLGPVSRKSRWLTGPVSCNAVYIKDRGFNSFASNMIKLSVNETKWSSLLARTGALILYILIWIFDFGPEKLPGLSRNGPQLWRWSTLTVRSDRNVFIQLTKLLSPVPLFCFLLTWTITKRAVAWVGSVQPQCTVPLVRGVSEISYRHFCWMGSAHRDR